MDFFEGITADFQGKKLKMEIFPVGWPEKRRTLGLSLPGSRGEKGFPRQFLPGVSLFSLPIPSPEFLLK